MRAPLISWLPLLLALLLAVGARAEDTVIVKPDGTIIMIGDTDPEPEPNFGGISGGPPVITLPAPGSNSSKPRSSSDRRSSRPAVTVDPSEALCEPDSFKENGSNFFWLYHCPTRAGWDAYGRISEVIDDAWVRVSDRYGSLYDTSKLEGYIYTTAAHYSHGTAAPPWSGGFYSPSDGQVHVPAPIGREGFRLKSLLVHELTHFRLDLLTRNPALGSGGIKYFRFLNEGHAQQMEQHLFEAEGDGGTSERRRHLHFLGRAFQAGYSLLAYPEMMYTVRGDVRLFYAQSWATVAYLEATYGRRSLDRMLEEMKGIPRPRTQRDLTRICDRVLRAGTGLGADDLRQNVDAWIRREVVAEFGGGN